MDKEQFYGTGKALDRLKLAEGFIKDMAIKTAELEYLSSLYTGEYTPADFSHYNLKIRGLVGELYYPLNHPAVMENPQQAIKDMVQWYWLELEDFISEADFFTSLIGLYYGYYTLKDILGEELFPYTPEDWQTWAEEGEGWSTPNILK